MSSKAPERTQIDARFNAWRIFFQRNCDCLFQLALLLTADPERAEATLAAAIGEFDTTEAPDWNALAQVQKSVARLAVEFSGPPNRTKAAEAEAMLPRRLRPVLSIEAASRACFVLRMLLGYATTSCAGMLGMESGAFKALLRIGILQLHGAVVRGAYAVEPGSAGYGDSFSGENTACSEVLAAGGV